MRYRIGEVAEFFGMTKEGVRFLERQGIIVSQRDEANGYRYFERAEITRLKQIRSYQALGFSLEEAADMVCRTPRSELLSRIDEKLAELEKKEEQLHRMRGMLLGQRRAAESVLGERGIELVMRPEMILFPIVRDQASGATSEEKAKIAQARMAEKVWIQAMPPVMLGAIHCDAQGKMIHGLRGSVATMDVVRALGLPVLPCMIHLPGCLCVRSTQDALAVRGVDVEPLRAWAQAQGYTPCGDVFAMIQATYCDENGSTCRIRDVYLPVHEK